LCDGGIYGRYNLFTLSYKNNELSKDEYIELVKDLSILTNIDTTGCSVESKRKMLSDIQFIETVLPLIMKL